MSLDPSSSALHLNLPPSSSSQARPPTLIVVHPSVIASILIHHQRRPATSTVQRVIGTLLGIRNETGLEVEVRSSFAVPHSEGEEAVTIDMPFQQSMAGLISRAGPKEVIVGWYATDAEINANSALMQAYFTAQSSPYAAIHLTVDMNLTPEGNGLGVRGWFAQQIGDKSENCVFMPVPVQVKQGEAERAALNLLSSPNPQPSLPPLPALSSSLSELSNLIDACLTYVQSVIKGDVVADPEVGRYLLEGVGRWSNASEEEGVKKGLQDTLTVEYVANLVRSQMELSARLALLPQA
ncbi:hypothetical protein TREMEDRAFT_74088 [Tremella mesenterica DSM 1558]|uniref:uncharacterized protein n=1 Tax=Tremella mesenterica (strain ATCC 24925 / CBS 8224 / DSM 1558 / NBRC 9311 / NRRL Y-6157 / RJB 2259-6 / UBC 559-6) TaxID=578456 RepID=UPI0003F48EBC|nr:uncharacterized protein TREMEDRAFT_74088 [Tremella mesenterica DSM 1558]EIW68555.1 hypothetical protein TREMEDRAFT_74088 [Tremella mesenterica DSM 1558]